MVNKNENAPIVASPTIEAERNCRLNNLLILRPDSTLDFRKSQETDDSILLDYLGIGRENALTAGQLAAMLGVRKRAVSVAVEKLRREGVPICASCAAGEAGYFLASNAAELESYCTSLDTRLRSIRATLAAVQETCKRLSAAEDR